MKKISALLCAIALFGACQSNQAEAPTLSDDTIAQIMADLSVADAATTGLAGFQKDSLMHVYFNQVFEMHNITLESYEKDLRILAKDLPRLERIVKKSEVLITGEKPAGDKPSGDNVPKK